MLSTLYSCIAFFNNVNLLSSIIHMLNLYKAIIKNEAFRKFQYCPDWCGSVGWVLHCKPEVAGMMGHVPGLWARSPVRGMLEATDGCFSHTLMFLSLSFSFPYPLSRNK